MKPKPAIRLCGQNCTQRFFEGFIVRPATLNNCKWCPQAYPDSRRRFFAGMIRLRLRCALRWEMAKSASHCGNSLRFRLQFKKSQAIAVAMPWCTNRIWRNHVGSCRDHGTQIQRKAKGQQLKGKIVSALFHTFSHTFSRTFPHFSEIFPKDFS